MKASAGRAALRSRTRPDESWGFNGRATWEPVFDTGKIVHLGLSGYYRTALKSGDTEDAVRLSDRPNIRVDNGNIADSGVITGVESLHYAGAEAAAVFGPFTVAGEVGRLWLDRPDLNNEVLHRILRLCGLHADRRNPALQRRQFRPRATVQGARQGRPWRVRAGACDTTASICPTRRCSRAPAMRRRASRSGLNWYFNPYAKLMFNWVRFSGDNTPLDPDGSKTKGDAFATRLHLDF